MKGFIFLTLFFLCSNCFGQELFSNSYHYNFASENEKTEGTRKLICLNSCIYFTSISNNYNGPSDHHLEIYKLDSLGNVLFSKNYTRENQNYNFGDLMYHKNSLYAPFTAVHYDSAIAYGGFIKFNLEGDTLIYEEYTSGLELTNFGGITKSFNDGFTFVGYTKNYNDIPMSQLIVMEIDSLGNELWQKQYGGSKKESASCIIQTPDTCYMIAGWSTSFTALRGYIVKIDRYGNLKWQKTYGLPYTTNFEQIIKTQDDNYLLVGSRKNANLSSPNNDSECWIVKIDKNGTVIWQKNYDIAIYASESLFAVKELENGDLVACGEHYDTLNTQLDGLILKINANGDLLWSRTYKHQKYNTDGNQDLFTIDTDNKGNIICGGFAAGSLLNQDVWILKVDSNGCLDTTCIIDGLKSYKKNEFLVYPNPSTGKINLSKEAIDFKLYNSLAELILQKDKAELSNNNAIDLEIKTMGIYYYRIVLKDGGLKSGKIIIESVK